MPAQAGIQYARFDAEAVDSRLRGNDGDATSLVKAF